MLAHKPTDRTVSGLVNGMYLCDHQAEEIIWGHIKLSTVYNYKGFSSEEN